MRSRALAGLRYLGSSGSRLHNTAAATAGHLEVAAIDPLFVLEPERLVTAAAAHRSGDPVSVQPWVTVSVPHRLLAQLHRGQLELAEHDDPGNHWYFGERGELFQYQFVGRHHVQSGFTSLVLAHELQQLLKAPERRNRKQADQNQWLAFLKHISGSSGEGLWPTPSMPLLFAGKAIECESVGVYTLSKGGSTQGLMLSTEFETPQA